MTPVRTAWWTVTALSLSVLTACLPLSFLSALLVAVVVCSALGRLQRGALCRDAAAEIWLDPAKERREQVGQQRHPAVPRISGCRAVPPFSTQTHTHAPSHTHVRTTSRFEFSSRYTHKHLHHVGIQAQSTPTKQEHSNMHMSKGQAQWKYCPLMQVCWTKIIQTVGECWQIINNTKVNHLNTWKAYFTAKLGQRRLI